jgi:conjugal transfer pilus assembly protein TraW
MKLFIHGLLLLMFQNTFAMSLGVVGEVYVVEEENMLTWIESRVKELEQTGEFKAIQAHWVGQVSQHANRPQSLALPRAKKSYQHRYYPNIVLQQDVLDAQGHILFPRGLKLNALDSLSTYSPHWMFLNADDHAQLKWAKQQLLVTPAAKVILTAGAILDTEKQLQQPIYFDQGGRITQKLGIQHVPALVSRDKHALLIREIAIREDGYAR